MTSTATHAAHAIPVTAASMIRCIPCRGSRVMRDPIMAAPLARPVPIIDDPDQMTFGDLIAGAASAEPARKNP